MIVRAMRISEKRVFHKARDGPAQPRPPTAFHSILDGLSELKSPRSRWVRLGKVVAVENHGVPDVAEEVVHGTAGADEEVAFGTEGPERDADTHVVVRVVAGIHGHNCRG